MKREKSIFTSTLNEELKKKKQLKARHNIFVSSTNVKQEESLKKANLKLLLNKLKDYSGVESREKAGK